jgi:tetratricopeptide (TPR) repeat protein
MDGETQGPAVTAASLGLGQAYLYLGDYPEGEANLSRALAGARETGDVRTQAQALAWLSQIAQHLGELDRAQALIDEALPLARAAGGRTLALTLARAADIDLSAGNLDAAEARATAAVEAARHVEDITFEINALITLGNIASTRRQLDEAMRQTEAVLVLARRARNLLYESMTLLNLGDNAYRRGDFTIARACGRRGLELFRELGQQVFVALILGNLAQADLKLGDAAAARSGAREALILSRELGSMPIVLFAVMVFAQILAAGGELRRALALYGLARAHPALEYAGQLEVDEEVARLGLPTEEVEAGLATGAALDFETVVQEILDGKW